ncbi:MAG TPA: rhomboid family intramembrane serine protease [Candidatus Acidoferrum sp.]|nr:rhomboid family intramembrane serine protease [Candidatus Acidoferrum sp.]
MLIPLKDLNPRRRFPVVNVLLIAANIAVFVYQAGLPARAQNAFVLSNSTIPARIPSFFAGHLPFAVAFVPLLTSMFLHSGILHIAGNMLFLWIFGDNIEDYFGHARYLLFYLACGVGAGLLHILFNLHSRTPALGASGAISGVMGAYLILFPRSRVLTLVFIFLIPLPAILVLGYWFVIQFLEGIGSLGMTATGGVAWWAHIGGFLLGMLFASASERRQLQSA